MRQAGIEKSADEAVMNESEVKARRSVLITVICDAVLLVLFIAGLLIYNSRNNINNYNQNVETITSIATSNAQLMQAALDNTGYEVKSAYNYCRGRSVEEILDYLSRIYEEEEYQLLKRDETVSTDSFHVYSGYSTEKENGEYVAVRYEDTALSYSIYNYSSDEVGKISFSQSFTNKTDALRYFAVFCGINVSENGTMQKYYLVKPQKESKVLSQAQNYSQYKKMAVAVCYTDGKYLAYDNNFRSGNFYDYLYKYNGLSVDQKNAIKASVHRDADGVGTLTYKDFQGNECIFAYAKCGEDNRWLVIVSVPVSEFASPRLLTIFPLAIIIFLSILLFFNIFRLLGVVQQLRLSVARERIANVAKGSFLSRMSHEIRTPLNAVIGYNNIARNKLTSAENDVERRQAEMTVIDCLSKSEIASRHLLTIINDVLDMSAIENGKIRVAHDRFDFRGLITSLTTIFYSQACSKNVEFKVEFDTITEEWLVGDQMRVNQILTNILANAVKFTSGGGSVTLQISELSAEDAVSHIRFKISDTGIGMTKEYLNNIWTPFEQADSSISRRFGGTGLGLSITKSLVELMNGTISVDSTLGVGTVFTVDLIFERTEQPLNTGSYDFSAESILVVDDDIGTCDYVRMLCNRCGASCAAVTSGADAIKAVSVAKERGEHYTLCLVDWRMPGMDGMETVERIRKIVGDEMPIIVLTAYDYSEIADRAAEIGIDKFISKPLFQSSLFDLIASMSKTQMKNPNEKNDGLDFSGTRILLAEDNAMNMEIAKTILESAHFKVDCAWNGKEAVELFSAAQPGQYAVILMDVHMPEMNGHDAARVIRGLDHSDAKTIPIIAMTADAFAENVAEAYAAGMSDHIAKPIDIPTLFETIKKYL